jgi:hypothetical protein
VGVSRFRSRIWQRTVAALLALVVAVTSCALPIAGPAAGFGSLCGGDGACRCSSESIRAGRCCCRDKNSEQTSHACCGTAPARSVAVAKSCCAGKSSSSESVSKPSCCESRSPRAAVVTNSATANHDVSTSTSGDCDCGRLPPLVWLVFVEPRCVGPALQLKTPPSDVERIAILSEHWAFTAESPETPPPRSARV